MVQGEAIAWHHGEEGYQRAPEATHWPEAGSPEHALALWTARFARRRLDELRGNHHVGKLELKARWRRRRGSLLDERLAIEDLLSAH